MNKSLDCKIWRDIKSHILIMTVKPKLFIFLFTEKSFPKAQQKINTQKLTKKSIQYTTFQYSLISIFFNWILQLRLPKEQIGARLIMPGLVRILG